MRSPWWRAAHELALATGRVDVGGMLRGLTAKQFMAWVSYMRLHPIGERRADYRAASVCAVIANVNRGKDQKPFTVEDFLLKFGEEAPERKQTWQEKQAVARAIVMAYSVQAKDMN
ncbi:MAG: DUF4035 domain-containing protein [Sulfuricaulis sp.]|nr:DUF4035 domain-containing protein [Sulfuricaulis sp.]